MPPETEDRLSSIAKLLAGVKDASRYDWRIHRLEELEKAQCKEGFWNDPDAANTVIQELKIHKEIVDNVQRLERGYSDAQTLFELAREEDDEGSLAEVETESHRLLKKAEALELQTMLSGRYDEGSCYLSIQAGAGGTDSCDWAGMLKRMYQRWAEREGYKVQLLEEVPGEETGIKSVTFRLTGPFGYGYLRSEMGVHRLVRISPFGAQARRHTSFASVAVSPEVSDIDIEINDVDLRIDTYRASGAGGQHVNTTDSAVRITHTPTGIVVQCQNERSQHSNRAAALRVLKSRLLAHEEQKRDAELASIGGEKGEISFGNQIRSYWLHPNKLVKDHRSGAETGNVDHVLDGDLSLLIESYLRWHARQAGSESRN